MGPGGGGGSLGLFCPLVEGGGGGAGAGAGATGGADSARFRPMAGEAGMAHFWTANEMKALITEDQHHMTVANTRVRVRQPTWINNMQQLLVQDAQEVGEVPQ